MGLLGMQIIVWWLLARPPEPLPPARLHREGQTSAWVTLSHEHYLPKKGSDGSHR